MLKLVQKRYCDFDYDTGMILLFDAEDEEAQSDDDLDIYWISSGNEKLSDIPPPPTRRARRQRVKKGGAPTTSERPSESLKWRGPATTTATAKTKSFKLRVRKSAKRSRSSHGAAAGPPPAQRAAVGRKMEPNVTMTAPVSLSAQFAPPIGAPLAAAPGAYAQIPSFAVNPMKAAHSGRLMKTAMAHPPMGPIPYFNAVPFQ